MSASRGGIAVLPFRPIPDSPDGWRDRSACRDEDPTVMTPEPDAYMTKKLRQALTAAYATAKAVCAHCPVKAICLETTLAGERGTNEYQRAGVAGGLTPDERADEAVSAVALARLRGGR
ncbi:WhiB family transcriptional regulator [Frankia sp. AvcI1]|uniref:WhiB family transcriptional regulator n=1 Tax=Frankia sp. AvcI1 TaxID=573496 RepID=UPI002118627E|nr:WhiB family transcriptional regulator [Frankia sp. AvcI1]